MSIENKTYFVIIISFIISIITTKILINKYDLYEISTDAIENHRMVKGDIPSIWINGETIKREMENGKNYFVTGKEIHRSYLPPRLIALYSYVFNYNLFEDWEKKIISSENKKIYYLILQSIFYYTVLVFFFKKILKQYNAKACFFIICFLSFEPTIFFFHSSFHTESIYFSLQILMLTLMLDDSQRKTRFITIGLLLGVMYLQKVVTMLYIVPISLFYIYKFKKKSLIPLFFITFSYLIVVLMIGISNYKRAGVFYITPPGNKTVLHLYLPNIIVSKAEKISINKVNLKKKSDEQKWLEENKIDLNSEPDRLKYYNYLQNYTFKILLKYPITTFKYMVWKTFQTGILNPIYVLEFFEYENEKRPPYYLKDSYKKINIPLRILYCIIIYGIVIFGFFNSKRDIKFEHYVLLTFSSMCMLGMLGWIGNSRYMVPILIYLSIFFGHGAANLLEKIKIKS